ncbi:phosphopentomutase/phosphoglucosamine mutase [Halobellus captivus]|uniref:phosphopentomutase/phosphoglucosamine mutase n=1 Tax=Halobellus captivus TaxID=2592614 RepID=UPI0011A15718|nr:phosphopentomutase/phosphoglucosamine mutase [Halobellus captivus]
MFGTSGIRGPVGDVVNARLALDVGRAVAAELNTVVVGRDARTTGEVLADAVSAGARECGADVVRVGVVSTPTLARSVQWLRADAGVGITASHNPAPDNGIKLWNPSGQAFTPDQTDDIEGRLTNDGVESASWDAFGTERAVHDASERHVDTLVSGRRGVPSVHASTSSPNPVAAGREPFDEVPEQEPFDDLSVVVDLGNGTGRVTVDALYELGATVHTLDAQPDGRFPSRKSEPNAETLTALRSAVPSLEADFGIAHDGDADRMVAVTPDGEYVPGDVLLALFARDAVRAAAFDEEESANDHPKSANTADQKRPHVAVPVDTSLVVADTVKNAGGTVTRTPVGDVHIAAAASKAEYVFGGEPSGAWIWPDATLAPDGHLAAIRLSSLVAQRGSLESLVDDIPTETYTTRRKNVSVSDRSESMAAIEAELRRRYDDIDTIDGLRADTDDGWFLVRPSGTEPLIRVTAEARDERLADDLLESAHDVVTDRAIR